MFAKLSGQPKLELFIALRHVLLYEVSRWRKGRTIYKISYYLNNNRNDLELHSIDIEQVFLQTDKLMEGVNDRYFINPSPGSPDANNKDIFV
jgi:hypothetical protein